MSPGFRHALTALFGERVRVGEALAGHTTCRLGGPAELWLRVNQVDELVQAVMLARQHEAPCYVIGSGANILISDRGLPALVIQNQAEGVSFPDLSEAQPGDTVTVMAASGVALPSLAQRCANRGLSGFEWAVGVPGTMGGAVVNNAGAFGSDMATNLEAIEVLSPDGERMWQSVEWLEYDYRESRLKAWAQQQNRAGESRTYGWVVLQARLQLTVAPVEDIKVQMAAFNQKRKASQPPGATLGSMFKNPPGDYAGRLIDAAGLKAQQVGQAQISPVHANFFHNLGHASTSDLLALVKLAQETVSSRFGINLELEVEVIGE